MSRFVSSWKHRRAHPMRARPERDAISRRAGRGARHSDRAQITPQIWSRAQRARLRVVHPISEPPRPRVVMSYVVANVVANVVARQEATMKTLFGCAAAILVATTAANAQTTIIERDNPSVVTRERIELTPAQRTTIYRTVTRERVRTAEPGFAVRLGARVPQAVELSEIPAAVIEEVPTVRRYRYMVVNNEVVLVDPATSEVVEIIRP